jgi:hypothetical protein
MMLGGTGRTFCSFVRLHIAVPAHERSRVSIEDVAALWNVGRATLCRALSGSSAAQERRPENVLPENGRTQETWALVRCLDHTTQGPKGSQGALLSSAIPGQRTRKLHHLAEKQGYLGDKPLKGGVIAGANSPCHQEIGRLAETQQSWGAGRYFRFWRAAISSSMLTSSVG